MKIVSLVILVLLALVSLTCPAHAETQVNTCLSWNKDGLTGNLVHRDIQFAGIVEDEAMIGQPVSTDLTILATYTDDSNDNQRLGTVLAYHDEIGNWQIQANLMLYAGLDNSGNRIKTAVYCTRPIARNLAAGIYLLDNRVSGCDCYQEGGAIISGQSGNASANFYLLAKNTGQFGTQFDIGLTF